MRRVVTGLTLSGLVVLGLSAAVAAEDTRVGRKIENFKLHDARGPERSLSEWSDAKYLVIAFLGTECPLANAYAPRLGEMAAALKPRGVEFIGINSNQQDTISEVATHALRMEFPFAVLKDPGNQIADLFGAKRTPEVFLLDRDRVIRYVGRIDDQMGIGYQKLKAEREDLQLAIMELLGGQSVSKPSTDVIGCLIGRVQRPVAGGDVTFSKHIAHILQDRCVVCHHEGQGAPFSLTNFEETVGWAEMIKEVVHERRMPPWDAAPEHGHFKNNPSLSDEQINLIDRWLAGGCPEGDKKDLPAPVEYAKGWGISKPDQVFYMRDEPYTVPSTGVVRYQYFTVDPGLTEDRWIKEAEVRTDNPAVVHHVIVYVQKQGQQGFGDPQMAYAPGMTPRRLDGGAAIRMPAGSKLVFQCHYTPNGTEQNDRSYVGFVYAKPEEVTHEVIGGNCGNAQLKIPPHEANHIVRAEKVFNRDTTLLGMNPHMHLRGKSFRYEIVSPDGARETLLDVPRYSFNWQLWYMLEQPRFLPKGTRMICTASFDNSADNPSNPNPEQEVRWGEQTWDEMMFGFYSVIEPRVAPASAGQ